MTATLPVSRERRAAPRTHTVREHGIEQARIRPGREAAVVDASSGGIFIETHPHPESALSDGPNMIPLKEMPNLIETLARLHSVARWNAKVP